jgi:hypothetical protein
VVWGLDPKNKIFYSPRSAFWDRMANVL